MRFPTRDVALKNTFSGVLMILSNGWRICFMRVLFQLVDAAPQRTHPKYPTTPHHTPTSPPAVSSQYYVTQNLGTCLSKMVNAPTRSPSSTAGLWCVAKVSMPWEKGYCECQTIPTAAGITYYESQFNCCTKHYSGQNPAVCFSMVVNAPTKSPSSDTEPQFYPVRGIIRIILFCHRLTCS